MLRKIHGWIKDYLHATYTHLHTIIIKEPPKHFLGHIITGKKPIILIPGYLEKWNFLSKIANPLSHVGHPIYVVKNLGYNTNEVHFSAELIHELIRENSLKNIILISHSKGGLIGKYLLSFKNEDGAIEKLIAVATPWAGSHAAKLIPHKSAKELRPNSEILEKLNIQSKVNHKIVSIYGIYDNHVWPTKSCYLDGAKNIEVDTYGHHTILFGNDVVKIIEKEVEAI